MPKRIRILPDLILRHRQLLMNCVIVVVCLMFRLSKEEGLELIANERRIELAAEGFRSDDMYRYSDEYWNKHINNVEIAAPDGDNIITMSWNPRMHLRPIPQTAIDLNPLLADDQNPGY